LVRDYQKPTHQTIWTWRPLDRQTIPRLLTGKSYHSYWKMCLWKSDRRYGCSKMVLLLILVVLPFLNNSFQIVGWAEGSVCLACKITRPYTHELLSLGSYEVPGAC
jgi:hypothetical protein